ncbi:MAG: anhydro-N-acetylmuramic acid kinase [Pseudomonadota bacterium]
MKQAGPVWALGAMSGTSMDGVDAALLRTDGVEIHGFGKTGYRAYPPEERAVLRGLLGSWPGDPGLEAGAEVVERRHALALSGFPEAELIGFHGQTVAHDPRGRGTHQIGSGQVLAEVLNKPVVWDFRTADVEMGGQGAPLAPFYHFALAKYLGEAAPVAFLNLGGVGNLSWIDPSKPAPEADGALMAFDTGPANAPIDDLVFERRGQRFDDGGGLAEQGTPDRSIVDRALGLPYFLKLPPKSLDRNDFDILRQAVAELSDADAAATLAHVAAAAVAAGLDHVPQPPSRILVAGGGRKNPVLMGFLHDRCQLPVLAVEEVGLDGDMLEAQAFAYLAVRVARGLPTTCPGTTGVAAAIGGGIVSRPMPDQRGTDLSRAKG